MRSHPKENLHNQDYDLGKMNHHVLGTFQCHRMQLYHLSKMFHCRMNYPRLLKQDHKGDLMKNFSHTYQTSIHQLQSVPWCKGKYLDLLFHYYL